MNKRRSALAVLILLPLLFSSGCLIIDPDDDWNETEKIVYVNHTGAYVENYIDDDYVGTVAPWSEMRTRSKYYDGRHKFYSIAADAEYEWGPDWFHVDDGETFVIDLYINGSMKFSKAVEE